MGRKSFKAYFDGSYRPIEKCACIGGFILDPKGKVVCKFSRRMPDIYDSNIVEYFALLEILKYIKKFKIKNVIIYGDNKNVVDQIYGSSKVNNNHYNAYKKTISLFSKIPNCKIIWKKRKHNGRADKLSKSFKNKEVVDDKYKINNNFKLSYQLDENTKTRISDIYLLDKQIIT